MFATRDRSLKCILWGDMNESERFVLGMIHSGELIVSNDGKIYRTRKWVNSKVGYKQLSIPSRAEYKNSGYYEVHIKREKKVYRCKSHRISWMYFNKSEIPDGMEINHINGIRSDNSPQNLEVVTQSENILHSFRIGLAHGRPGEKHHLVKITEKDVRDIRLMYNNGGISQSKIGQIYGLSQTHIGRIIRQERWKCV